MTTTNQQQHMMLPRIVTVTEIESITSQSTFIINLINGLRNGFLHYDKFYMAPIQTLGSPPISPSFMKKQSNKSTTTTITTTTTSTSSGQQQEQQVSDNENYCAQTCIKTGYFIGGDYFVLKIASGGYPFPYNSGLMQLFSQRTGIIECILYDNGILTEYRTGAICSLVFSIWAPPEENITSIGILGCGVQARYQLYCLATVTSCRTVLVYGRNINKVQEYITEMSQYGWIISIVTEPNDLLKYCTVVITTTSCTGQPLLTIYDTTIVSKTKLLLCIGSDTIGKKEVSNTILQNYTNYCIADNPEQSYVRGEFQGLINNNNNNNSINLVSLQDALQNTSSHRRRQQQQQQQQHQQHEDGGNDNNDNNNNVNIIKNNNSDEIVEAKKKNNNNDGLIVFDSSGLALQDYVIAEMVYHTLVNGTKYKSDKHTTKATKMK